jgi:MYXO-CTERM domain-containing protein
MRTLTRILSLAALLAVGASAQASTVVLPNANSLSAGTYGDFTVYSLDLLAQCEPVDIRCRPYSGDKGGGSPQLNVSSQQLDNQMIIYRNENGSPTSNYVAGPLAGGTIATAGVDNPFDAPTGAGSTTFDMSTTNEPRTETAGTTGCAADFTADKCGTWEAKLSSVQNYVKGNKVVFLFDNNQVGTSVNQQQYFWAQLKILDAAGNDTGMCFELDNTTVSGCKPFTDWSSIASPGDFVGSGGGFCVDAITGAAYLIGPTGTDHPTQKSQCNHNPGDYFVNNNLGQSTAEFAATLDTLNSNLASWAAAGYTMSIDFKMRNLNDGGEELWICSDCSIGTSIPEPATVSLVALALLGLGAAARRRRA